MTMSPQTQSLKPLQLSDQTYGALPTPLGIYDLSRTWKEFVHYLYMPIRMADGLPFDFRLPKRMGFLSAMIDNIIVDARNVPYYDTLDDKYYIYLTCRRGFASPDNPLNRPGWHADGFGTRDLNYIWYDRWPTRVAHQVFEDIDVTHGSMLQFEEQVKEESVITDMECLRLWRYDPSVVHATPLVPAPGGMRSFIKISVSPHRYNLEGNAHNFQFDYNWKMYPRDATRNDTSYPELDFVEENHDH